MDVFQAYKPIRNKIASLAIDDSLAVIWAYCQYLQINGFVFPPEIEVERKFLGLDVPQKWISEWTLELLAKEVILNGNSVSSKNRTLRKWNTLSELINLLMHLENEIYGHFGSDKKILLELVRMAHRQFIWQGNTPIRPPPNKRGEEEELPLPSSLAKTPSPLAPSLPVSACTWPGSYSAPNCRRILRARDRDPVGCGDAAIFTPREVTE
jgi:hypothetical protein